MFSPYNELRLKNSHRIEVILLVVSKFEANLHYLNISYYLHYNTVVNLTYFLHLKYKFCFVTTNFADDVTISVDRTFESFSSNMGACGH